MSITINLEIGHDASLRSKTTPEGFTHDWEVYVKGCNGAEIHHYIDKVVFHLHETFPKPKRVVKEPPYSLRTSGYAGFNLPIDIYLRNSQEPKKIRFNYDLQLQPRGPPIHNVQKEKYVFHSPSEDFRIKLLKGGGIVGAVGSAQDTGDSKSIDEKNQMTSKPKLSGSDVPKKHKIKLDEPRNTDFLNLFGTPITKTTSRAPEPPKPKEVPKSFPKIDKPVEKDKSKTKSPHKEKEKEKPKDKDKSSDSSEKRKSKEDKSKDRDRAKEKSSKKDKEREKSPSSRPRSPSPKRSPKRPPSPPPVKHSSSKEKEQSKEERKDKDRKDEKKNKKEKREHKESKHKDRDKDKEHKEHKNRDSKSGKESSSSNVKEKDASPTPVNITNSQRIEKKEKSKESLKEPKDEEKSEKSRSDKSEDKQKHKHKKKDRKEKREDKYSSKTEKKSERPPNNVLPVKEESREPPPVTPSRDSDKSNLFGSPKSEPPSTPVQTEPKDKAPNAITFKDEEASNDSLKASSRESSPVPRSACKSPCEPPPEPVKKQEVDKKKEESLKKKEKKEKKKDKKNDRDHEKRRKRKSSPTLMEVEQRPEKLLKEEENNNSDDERKVSSTEDANPLPKNEDYMGMLRDLQIKIMGLKENSDLQKVVQLIAKTGRYEISKHSFDFDLCVLDRSTVRQLQDFFASLS